MAKNLQSELEGLVGTVTSSLARELEDLIERRAVELVAERLGVSVVSTGRGRRRAPSRRARRASPAASKDNGARILAYVKAHPGERSEKVRAAVKLGRGQWIYALNGLIASKQIGRKGVKRASTLHPR